MRKRSPVLPLFIDDYEAATAHLTIEEDGVYMRLLRIQWRTPKGKLPNDDDWIRRRMRCTPDQYQTLVKPIIEEFFQTDGNYVFQARLLREFTYTKNTSKKQSDRANSRWNKEKGVSRGTCRSDAPYPTLTSKKEKKKEDDDLNDSKKGEKANETKYAFEGDVLLISEKHFAEWVKAFHTIDLRAALVSYDAYYSSQGVERGKAYYRCSQALANKHEKNLLAQKEEKAQNSKTIGQIARETPW